jgi:hypothetical protein
MEALDKAIYDYHNTDKTITTILKETGISKATFYRHLDYKEEFRAKKKARTYTFNFDKFKIDSHEKYYWLGFIGADGAVVKNTLSIELKETDKAHLEKFNLFFENTKTIEERVNNNGCKCVKTNINSFQLVEYLKQYNIYQNKSLTYTIPIDKIPEIYLMDFIRGLIDGDGCIRINNHQQISLGFCSGNGYCVEQFKEILGITNKTTKDKYTYHTQVTGNIKAKAILDKIYLNSSDSTRLDRKYRIYKTLN